MSRHLLRSALELRTPVTRLPPSFLLPIRARSFHQTPQIVESGQQPDAGVLQGAKGSQAQSIAQRPSGTPSKPAASAASSQPRSASTTTSSEINPATATPATTQAEDPSISALLPLLAAQPGHYATVHIHGRPYLVTAGDQVRLPFRMPGVQAGDVLRLNRATALGSRDLTLRGAPFIDERRFECRAVVLGAEAEPMRVMIKKKQRTRRKKHVRSKHKFTVLRVSELKINLDGDGEV